MNPVLPDDALEFGDTARKAFEKIGGVDAARAAEEEPTRRAGEIAETLRALGIDELDPRDDADVFAAAAALCEAAGRNVVPYPVVGAILQRDGVPFALVPDDRARIDHGDLFPTWNIASIDGGSTTAKPSGASPFGSRLGPFVTECTATVDTWCDSGVTHESGIDTRYWLVLTAFQVLGATDRAVELAADHVTNRIQFGKPISAFQAVQFMLADAAVAVSGLRELAHFTLWRVATNPIESGVDALALRLHAIDTARAVLRTCQQLHGASGVCDEYDISVITRHIQPALRLPFGAERTAAEMNTAVQAMGFAGLFPHGGAA